MLRDAWFGNFVYPLPVADILGLGWPLVTVILEFRERSFRVQGAKLMAPFALRMTGCLAPYAYFPVVRVWE